MSVIHSCRVTFALLRLVGVLSPDQYRRVRAELAGMNHNLDVEHGTQLVEALVAHIGDGE